ncbi:MAG: DUF4390 domain-containing protein [Gammaproteobacteria bacterium]|nr:DUF4390 domain-containing protein [Gammaproteobacteria bacterium]MCF6230647.1 DUF4390 domain-containing protein [Gammaproteobacteria bacterium]
MKREQPTITTYLLPLLLLLCYQPAFAEKFEIVDAEVSLHNEIYHLSSTIRYPLDTELTTALYRGVVLPIKVIVEVYRPRRYLPDTEIAFLKQRYELRFHALTRQYLVTNYNSGARASYSSLTLALQHLGSINNLPIIDKNLLAEGTEYRLRVRAAINTGLLAIPLKLTSYFYGPWRNESEWWDMPL